MSDPVWELVYANPELADLDRAARRDALRELFARSLPAEVVEEQLERCARAIDGYGPLTDLLDDESVTDVLVNGPSEVWVERAGKLEPTGLSFDDAELDALIDRIVGDAGERVDPLHPVADVSSPEGHRVHVVMPPVARPGPLVSIRRFTRTGLSLERLVELGAMSEQDATRLQRLVVDRAAMVISGATGTGKTTLLGALLGCVPADERVVVIEETRELRVAHPHVVSLATRDSNVEGRGAVSLETLVRTALRMRPDRIVVGEVRGPEARAALWAMSTGHRGSMLTVHAPSAAAVPKALAELASGGKDHSLRPRFEEQIEAFVHLERVGDRRVVAELVSRR